MDKSFASLLRHSKLATYDRRLNQIYTTPKHFKQQGDWGVKRNLPAVIRTPYLSIANLDTIEHQTPWTSGDHQVSFVRRWTTNFPNALPRSLPPQDIPSASLRINLASMSPRQFRRYVKHTITPDTIASIKQALNTDALTPEQVYDYLNVTFDPETPVALVGPVYSQPSKELLEQEVVVHGRILNPQQGGYAVGIGGVVALLPRRFAVGLKKPGDRMMVRKFYVRKAYLDDDGKPQVIVSLLPRSFASTAAGATTSSLASPTSALPKLTDAHPASTTHRHPATPSPSTSRWTDLTLEDLFQASLPNDMDELQHFLLDQDHRRNAKQHLRPTTLPHTSPTPVTAADASDSPIIKKKSQEELMENHSVLMNRIISLLKSGSIKKKGT
ncbi:hypothetical protein DM01DRAFT_253041 [Hesseltinella vesiculosa]|uniref:Uncharacterized protein n=1 Tax=Hesseltinella vesiculosa TaxID=101127 RepID=A0A1X2GV73_9FUNG|nr:hypothetical protein DM01DRAFT_253041 [Hesseltinella vesiculosa]